MYKAIDVANTILKIGCEHNISISNMKLQKLLYYAQGWFLAVNDEPLFEEDFKRWAFGPVCPPVYNKFKKYEANPIPCLSPKGGIIEDESVNKFLRKIVGSYGKHSAVQLSEISHTEKPWLETPPYETMLKDKIAAFFCKKMVARAS